VVATHGVDGELLRRFAAQRDEEAFAELVRRHGPMVLGVCRRLLGDTPDVDDAFQATFLVLVRRAREVARPGQLGNWLYGVAYRTALRARAATSRRRAREGRLVDVPAEGRLTECDWADLRPVLDEEVSRLPDRYRAAFVLCHLEGRTNAEAARLLGCPLGTVLSRLAWARGRLRSRLTRRGLALSSGFAAGLLSEDTLAAAVPPTLATATVRAALSFAVGQPAGAVPAGVAALANQVSGAMSMTRLKVMAAALAAAGALVFGATTGVLATGQDRPGPAPRVPLVRAESPAEGGGGQDAQEVSVKSLPPVVVKTVPQAGDTRVDAAKVTEIRVTFSKAMMDENWSWSQISDDTFPKLAGKSHYDKDKRTCVLSVKLEPGKTYVLWLNSEKFKNFQDSAGRPAVPYLLVFETQK
jgi:RNA polymerase sigma-70 factor (ECF subfamily)